MRRLLGRFALMGCGVLFALIVIVVALVLIFAPPAFLGGGQEPSAEQPTPPATPSPPPEETTGQTEEDDTPQTVTIRVTGTPGVAFRGNYAVSSGVSSGTLEGVTPKDFEVPVRSEEDVVAANVQKRDEGNERLTLQLIVGGEVVAEQSTTERWGGVSV